MVSREKHYRPCEGFYRTVDKLTDKKYKKIIVAYSIDDYHYSLAYQDMTVYRYIAYIDKIDKLPKTKYVIFTRMKNIYK